MKAQLADEVGTHQLAAYINSDIWSIEQKLDGLRIITVWDDGECREVLGRNGTPSTKVRPVDFLNTWDKAPKNLIMVDGEYLTRNVIGKYRPFDLLQFGDTDCTQFPYWERRSALRELFTECPSLYIRPLAAADTQPGKLRLVQRVMGMGGEGVMLKNKNGLYIPGTRSVETLKVKFTKTIDCFITRIGIDGKNNAAVAVIYSDKDGVPLGKPMEVARVSLNGKPAVNIGDVIEVRYLYLGNDVRLVQPRLVRVRDDKMWSECSVDQIQHDAPDVVIDEHFDDDPDAN